MIMKQNIILLLLFMFSIGIQAQSIKVSQTDKFTKDKVAKAISFGEKNGILRRKHNFKVVTSFSSHKEAINCLNYNFNNRLRVINNEVVYIMCNTYSIIEDKQAALIY